MSRQQQAQEVAAQEQDYFDLVLENLTAENLKRVIAACEKLLQEKTTQRKSCCED